MDDIIKDLERRMLSGEHCEIDLARAYIRSGMKEEARELIAEIRQNTKVIDALAGPPSITEQALSAASWTMATPIALLSEGIEKDSVLLLALSASSLPLPFLYLAYQVSKCENLSNGNTPLILSATYLAILIAQYYIVSKRNDYRESRREDAINNLGINFKQE